MPQILLILRVARSVLNVVKMLISPLLVFWVTRVILILQNIHPEVAVAANVTTSNSKASAGKPTVVSYLFLLVVTLWSYSKTCKHCLQQHEDNGQAQLPWGFTIHCTLGNPNQLSRPRSIPGVCRFVSPLMKEELDQRCQITRTE